MGFSSSSSKLYKVLLSSSLALIIRFLENLAVYFHLCGLLFAAVSPILCYYVAFRTKYWYVILVYCFWMYWDRNAGFVESRTPFHLLRQSFMKYYASYFPIKIVKSDNSYPTDRNYMIALYPHCLMALILPGMMPAGLQDNFPGVELSVAISDWFLRTPFAREYFLSLGCRAVSEWSILQYFANKKPSRALTILPGGVPEVIISSPDVYRIVLKSKKGFIRVALKAGLSLVPMFSFGENAVLEQYQNDLISKIQKIIRHFTTVITIFIPKGRTIFKGLPTFMPHRKPINVVYGERIDLPKIENPTKEDVDKYHKIFATQLESLFERNKDKYEPSGKHLQLVIE